MVSRIANALHRLDDVLLNSPQPKYDSSFRKTLIPKSKTIGNWSENDKQRFLKAYELIGSGMFDLI